MDVSNVVIGGVTLSSKCALGFNIDSCFQLILSLILQCSQGCQPLTSSNIENDREGMIDDFTSHDK